MPDYVPDINDPLEPLDSHWAMRGAQELRLLKENALIIEGQYPSKGPDYVLIVEEVYHFIARFGGRFEEVLVDVKVASADPLEFDVKINNVTIFTTKPTIDGAETTSLNAAVPAVIDAAARTFVRGDRISFHVTDAGDGLAEFAQFSAKVRRII